MHIKQSARLQQHNCRIKTTSLKHVPFLHSGRWRCAVETRWHSVVGGERTVVSHTASLSQTSPRRRTATARPRHDPGTLRHSVNMTQTIVTLTSMPDPWIVRLTKIKIVNNIFTFNLYLSLLWWHVNNKRKIMSKIRKEWTWLIGHVTRKRKLWQRERLRGKRTDVNRKSKCMMVWLERKEGAKENSYKLSMIMDTGGHDCLCPPEDVATDDVVTLKYVDRW